MTVTMREKISEVVKEFDAILHPGGLVKFLGTPQSEDSLYPKLGQRGYVVRIWPSEYPNVKQRVKYGERLSPFILNRVEHDPTLVGHSVWPERFSDEDLAARKLSYGRSGYALQFLLDTSLSDADRYPLKLRDLIVMDLDLALGPAVLAWGTDPKNIVQGLPLLGFDNDKYYGPATSVEVFEKYTSIKAALDPSGRGGDETTLAIVAELHGRLFLLYIGAWRDGYSPQTLRAIADAFVRYNVSYCRIEDNFGDGMFTALLQPHVLKAWKERNDRSRQDQQGGTELEGIKSNRVQKELRILAAMEPVTQGHRLVVSKKVIEDDHKMIMAIDGEEFRQHYSAFHQLTHLTRERDSLLHDDRLESIAIAVTNYAEIIGINPWDAAANRAEEKLEAELEHLFSDDLDDTGPATLHEGRISRPRVR
jgi:hypothetical protein